MLNALRLTDGVPAALFAERTGYPLAIAARALDEGVRRGLIDPDPSRIAATELGRRFLNQTLQLFLPASSAAPTPRAIPVAITESTARR
jgi:oxygen-independent coproporphyrinogen-3 oxidase